MPDAGVYFSSCTAGVGDAGGDGGGGGGYMTAPPYHHTTTPPRQGIVPQKARKDSKLDLKESTRADLEVTEIG
ncbi:hypothetical protein E2C01_039952 [Portunus trituberculatus]|uniref:Uncharacterized protein n=1 Tax=Portunus trituberculatus TaxID=210409 RepID=A0A5B7FM05_PORTR|nr:hypothetical protein [Portunus trituberculatus]